MGRAARYQNNGHDAVTTVAANASPLRRVHGGAERTGAARLENTPYRQAMAMRPATRESAARARASTDDGAAPVISGPAIAVATFPMAM